MLKVTAIIGFGGLVGTLAFGPSVRAQTLTDTLNVARAVGDTLRLQLDPTIRVALLPRCLRLPACITDQQHLMWGVVRTDSFTRAVATNAGATISEVGDTVVSCSSNPRTCVLLGTKHYVRVAAPVFTSATLATVKLTIISDLGLIRMPGFTRAPLFERDITMTVDCTGGVCHVIKQHIDRLT
ncbi:MAG: hypothetical protein ACR2OG_13270 [Gemmatimonadaceae bacterium]